MSINKDLAEERSRGTFDPDDITAILLGKDGMHRRRLAYRRAAEDPEFEVAERFNTMNRDDIYSESVRMYMVAINKFKEYGYNDTNNEQAMEARMFYLNAVFIDTYPFAIHHGAFIPSIKGQGTPEQIAAFLPKAENLEFIGTYAQTELGHGSFVRGLETTATYDKSTQEFVLQSPKLSSLKYWPGGLGRTCNYVVLMAQLIIDGKEYGIHPFMCQIRDINTHQPLPGVELGDVNYKFGTSAMDNGYMRLTQHRIPRTEMLMRYAQSEAIKWVRLVQDRNLDSPDFKSDLDNCFLGFCFFSSDPVKYANPKNVPSVSPDGKYTRQNVPPQVSYLSMTYLRMAITDHCAGALAKAVTIATRYSAVRRQTANSKGVEPQILDYQTQQMKLFPAISTAYALIFTASALRAIYDEILEAVGRNDISRLPELHNLTSGLKAFAADISNDHIEICRRSCGGHGYSHASGIPRLFQANVINCTVEGETTVMYLQCARSLMKFLRMVQAGESVPTRLEFLAESTAVPPRLKSATSFDFEMYSMAFKLNTLCMARTMAERLDKSTMNGAMDAPSAWTAHSVGLVQLAKVYARYLSVTLFFDALNKKKWEPNAGQVMAKVCEFYAVHSVLESSGIFLQNRILTPRQLNQLTTRRTELLSELRPNAVTLVDAFDYPDRMLNSCLGRYDGNVYEALYEYAKRSTLNQHQVHPSYHKYIKPMREALKAKL